MNPDVAPSRLTYPVSVYQAEGVLSTRLGITIDEAVHALVDRAAAGGLSLEDASKQVMARMTQAQDDLLTSDDAGVPVSTYPAEVREAAGVLSVHFGVSREVAIALLRRRATVDRRELAATAVTVMRERQIDPADRLAR